MFINLCEGEDIVATKIYRSKSKRNIDADDQNGETDTDDENSIDGDGKFLFRHKRFLQRIPKARKFSDRNRDALMNWNQSNSTATLGSNKNISLVLAALLENYDHNQRPGYGGLRSSRLLS